MWPQCGAYRYATDMCYMWYVNAVYSLYRHYILAVLSVHGSYLVFRAYAAPIITEHIVSLRYLYST